MAVIARRALMGLALLCTTLLLGCENTARQAGQRNLKGAINVLVSLDGAETFSREKLEEQGALAKEMAVDYRYLNPAVHIKIEVTRERDLIEKVKSRTRDGLGPDLILARGWMAHRLSAENLTRLVEIDQDDPTKKLNPGLLKRLRVGDKRFVGIPVVLLPQLACYNRQQIGKNPASLDELIAASEQGVKIGIALDLVDLFWTVGAWGGLAAENAVFSRNESRPVEHVALLSWLHTLFNVSQYLNINFYDQEDQLVEGLLNGRLDWITCRSINISRLRKQLGGKLGVGILPLGPGGHPTPITLTKVWAFGVNSSQSQQQIATSFAHFTVNTIMQRYMALITEQMLPANESIPIPKGQSEVLSAMLTSLKQSQQNGILVSLLFNDRNYELYKEATRAVTEMIYGERTPEQVRTVILRGNK
jgi:ABC-type glycerol-3-phosphate transport system substrate-binding protein